MSTFVILILSLASLLMFGILILLLEILYCFTIDMSYGDDYEITWTEWYFRGITFPFRFIFRYVYAMLICKVIRKHAWIDVEHGKFTREGRKDYLQECEICGKGKYYF